MTTITTGTTGPKAWKVALVGAAAGLATVVAINLPTTIDTFTGQQPSGATQARSFFEEHPAVGRTPAPPGSVTGFEYGNESTPGRAASPGVTTPYFGNSGELMPFENGAAPFVVPAQPNPADLKWLNGQPEPHVPTKNQMR